MLGLPQAELCLDLTHELPAVLPGEADDGESGRLGVDGEPGVQLEQGGAGREHFSPFPPDNLLAWLGVNVAPEQHQSGGDLNINSSGDLKMTDSPCTAVMFSDPVEAGPAKSDGDCEYKVIET